MIGSLGPVEFTASEDFIFTFSDMNITFKANYAGHKVLNRPEKLEFTGTDASTMSLKIRLDSQFGINPSDNIEALRDMTHTFSPVPLILNGNVIGRDLWVIDNMNVILDKVANDGYILSADVNLSLKEYIS